MQIMFPCAQTPPAEPVPQPPPAPVAKFSWASLSTSSSSSSAAAEDRPAATATATTATAATTAEAAKAESVASSSASPEPSDPADTKKDISDEVDSVKETGAEPTNNTVTSQTPQVAPMQVTTAAVAPLSSVQVEDVSIKEDIKILDDANRDTTAETVEKPTDNGNHAVIEESDVKPDSNGNFATDDNLNITNLKSFAHEESLDHAVKEDKPLTNGDVAMEETPEEEEEEEDVKKGEGLLQYKEDQWSPLNTDGKKQYDRDFLISLQTSKLALQKPGTLPPNMEVILHSPNLDTIRNVTSAPNLKMFDTQQPFRSSVSHNRGTPR